ncbi:type I methionyl aminopeptidase [Patescibacteria group bacterium]
MIPIRTELEIDTMSQGGQILAKIMKQLIADIKNGMKQMSDINEKAEEYMADVQVKPAFKGYRNYPASVCISVDSEVVHGIPAEKKTIEDGHLISLDIGIGYQGFYLDMAESFIKGQTDNDVGHKLIDITRAGLEAGITKAVAGNEVRDISRAVQQKVEEAGFGVVRQLVGHGIGRNLHEEPSVPNFISSGPSPKLKTGMVIAIEPMITEGNWRVFTHSDGWTVETTDHKLAAHIERTVAITSKGPQILTK